MKTLEEVIKDKATLTSAFEYINIYSYPNLNFNIKFNTYVYFKDILFNDSKEIYDFLKPFIYIVLLIIFSSSEVAIY